MKNIFKRIFFYFSVLILFTLITGSIYGIFLFYHVQDASLILKENTKPISIYDKDQTLVSTDSYFYEYCTLTEINPLIIKSFVAVEDRNFYQHQGISIPRMLQATWNNLTSGKITAGASTITQQYVKNAYLSNEQTISRKVNELAIALELEKKYTKDQIMEAYLNTILFGGNIYGIQMACKYYFNTLPKDINLVQAATLAGMIQMPNYYHPFRNTELANARKNVVLQCMYEEKYITEQEYQTAKTTHLNDFLEKGFTNTNISYLTPYIDYVYSTIPTKNDTINSIYTYLDVDIQKELYAILNNDYKLFNDDNLNCSIVVLDNKTYGVKAIAGNRSFNQRVINYASEVRLQPGSTIKPILDYAPAIEYLDYHPATIVVDEPYQYKNGTALKNYDGTYLGAITLRKALSDSRNIPAVKLFNTVGYEKAYEFAKSIGIENQDTIYEADAIGGATNGYTLLDLANAYSAFANLGYYKKASAISQIDYDLSTDYFNGKAKLVMKPSTAFLINNMLHDVFKNSSYDQTKTYMMAKTGQTNYDAKTRQTYNIPENATKDSLIVAYTKDITIAIWVGYENVRNGQYLDYYKKNIPRTIMKLLMDDFAEEGNYYSDIEGITKRYITIYNKQAYLAKENGYYEYFQTGNEPLSYPNYEIGI